MLLVCSKKQKPFWLHFREKQELAANSEFNAEHHRQQEVERRNAAETESTFQTYQDGVAQKETSERRSRDAYFNVEGREVARNDHDRAVRLAEERKRIVLRHADLIQDQVRFKPILSRISLDLNRSHLISG